MMTISITLFTFRQKHFVDEIADVRSQFDYLLSFSSTKMARSKIFGLIDQLNLKLKLMALSDKLMQENQPHARRYAVVGEFKSEADFIFYKMASATAFDEEESQ